MVRDKLRAQHADDVIGSIKRVALAQLAAGGPAAVSINAIGRELGVSGPALYRYVAGWDDLIVALMVDAYAELASVLATAADGRRTPQTRLSAVAAAYRGWALAEPHRYRLLFENHAAGSSDPRVADASQGAMDVLIGVVAERPHPRPTPGTGIPGWLAVRGRAPGDTPAAEAAIRLWGRLHGLVSLELSGCFAAMGLDIGPLYAREVRAELN